jgi:hypothetical protein
MLYIMAVELRPFSSHPSYHLSIHQILSSEERGGVPESPDTIFKAKQHSTPPTLNVANLVLII